MSRFPSKSAFLPSRLSLNVWWGFFWRTTLFTIMLMMLSSPVLNLALTLWAKANMNGVLLFMMWKQLNPTGWLMLTQTATSLFCMFPAMVLAWWMMLSAPVYRTYTLHHVRDDKDGAPQLAHNLRGAVRLGWSMFWRLMVNFAPLYAAYFALNAYQVHLASTYLSEVPNLGLMVAMLMAPTIYIYALTLHHLLRDAHRHWSIAARPHSHAELLSAFVAAVPATRHAAAETAALPASR